jgi:Hsp20/alpha crystallin family
MFASFHSSDVRPVFNMAVVKELGADELVVFTFQTFLGLCVEEESSLNSERYKKSFERVIKLPANIDASKVTASLEHGILQVTLPKAEAAKAIPIEIQSKL